MVSVLQVLPDPSAVVGADAVHVVGLFLHNLEVVEGARRYAATTGVDDVGPYIISTIEIGAKALNLAGSTIDIAELQQCVEGLTDHVSLTTADALAQLTELVRGATDTENGSIVAAVASIIGKLHTTVADLFGAEDAPVRAAISRSLSTVTDAALGEVQRTMAAHTASLRQIVDSDNPESPLYAMRREFQRTQAESRAALEGQIRDLRGLLEVSAAVEHTMARTAIKGLDFESQVAVIVDRIAKGAGDVSQATGGAPGRNGRSKKGDIVIDIASPHGSRPTRLVCETKDRTLSIVGWRDELEAARENRGAAVALGIAKGCTQVPGGDRLRVLDPTMMVVAFDPAGDDTDLLQAVYLLLRTQAVCLTAAADGDIDLTVAHQQLAATIDLLGEFDKMTRAGLTAGKQLDFVLDTANRLRDDLMSNLRSVLNLLSTPALASTAR